MGGGENIPHTKLLAKERKKKLSPLCLYSKKDVYMCITPRKERTGEELGLLSIPLLRVGVIQGVIHIFFAMCITPQTRNRELS